TDRRNQRDLELTRKRVVLVACQRDDCLALLDHASCERQDPGPHISEDDSSGLSLDQLHAEIVLQLLDLCRQGRLADEATFRCFAKMTGLGECDEVTKVA